MLFGYDDDWTATIANNGAIRIDTPGLSDNSIDTATLDLDNETWHHFAIVVNGTAKNVYIDGALDKTEAATGVEYLCAITTEDGEVLRGELSKSYETAFGTALGEAKLAFGELTEDMLEVRALGTYEVQVEEQVQPRAGGSSAKAYRAKKVTDLL